MKPPPVRFVDVDLTDNVPPAPPETFQRLEGRRLPVFQSPEGRVLLIPQRPLRAPSGWGLL